jgi:hypothetical protein
MLNDSHLLGSPNWWWHEVLTGETHYQGIDKSER